MRCQALGNHTLTLAHTHTHTHSHTHMPSVIDEFEREVMIMERLRQLPTHPHPHMFDSAAHCSVVKSRHPNILLLIGWVFDPPQFQIVTEFMHRGNRPPTHSHTHTHTHTDTHLLPLWLQAI